MALIKPSLYFDSISGKIGGHVFNNTSAGLVIQPIGMHRRSGSIVERQFISLSSMIVKMWGDLTESKRNDWRASALDYPYINRLGVSSYLSGYNHFVRCVGNLYAAGLNFVPPAPPLISIVPAASIIMDPLSSEIVIYADSPIDMQCVYIVSASPTFKSTKGDYTSHLRQLLVVSAQGLVNGFDLLPQYMDIFGRYEVGQKLTMNLKAVNSDYGISLDNYARVSSVIIP